MKTRISIFLESLKSSFWFIPVLMVCAAMVFSFAMVTLDRQLNLDSLRFYGFMYAVSPEGARSVLSTIAGSMMTVAGVTFSITIVVLNLASSQFGPRLLRNFMQDRGTQFVLGTFVSSFIYCLLVLRSVDTVGKDSFVPSFSVTFAVVLAFLNVGVLIYFIHHIATSIQADEVIAGVSRELQRSIRRIFADELIQESGDITGPIVNLQKDNVAHLHTYSIPALENGYIQAIEYDRLLQMATENDFLIRVLMKAGQFVVTGSPLANVSSEKERDDDLTRVLSKLFIIGEQRTPKQDAEYSIHQLVEVAIRALSPGINDPYTAINCIDQLGSALSFLAKRESAGENCFDDQGRLRLVIKTFDYAGMLNAAFDQIRQYGRTSVAVTIRLLEMLTMISGQTTVPEQRKAIHRQANMILRTSRESLPERNDKEDVLQRHQVLLAVLNEFDDREGPYAMPHGF